MIRLEQIQLNKLPTDYRNIYKFIDEITHALKLTLYDFIFVQLGSGLGIPYFVCLNQYGIRGCLYSYSLRNMCSNILFDIQGIQMVVMVVKLERIVLHAASNYLWIQQFCEIVFVISVFGIHIFIQLSVRTMQILKGNRGPFISYVMQKGTYVELCSYTVYIRMFSLCVTQRNECAFSVIERQCPNNNMWYLLTLDG